MLLLSMGKLCLLVPVSMLQCYSGPSSRSAPEDVEPSSVVGTRRAGWEGESVSWTSHLVCPSEAAYLQHLMPAGVL